MTLDEALARLVPKTRLTETDVSDLRNVIEYEDGNPGGLATIMREYARLGLVPDTTAWQDFAADLGEVEDAAQKLGPLIGIIIAVAVAL